MKCRHCHSEFTQGDDREFYCPTCTEKIFAQIRGRRVIGGLYLAKKFLGFRWVEGSNLYFYNGNGSFWLRNIVHQSRRGKLIGEWEIDPDEVYLNSFAPSEETRVNVRAMFTENIAVFEENVYRVKEDNFCYEDFD